MNNRLAYFRRLKRLTQQELADTTGINRVQISQYETTSIQPRARILIVLAQALDTTAEELFPPEGSSHDANN
jgi:transcriptional regulator with XRE-family HTH domain